eukprot:TRINITY_DN10197_c0_g1_i1.p1 TRINITY_DN10197_c0_g1~~TRINITY_DN10197_c0_g1_i1.p1  ORF type:complete len:423 (-),score=124.68 TRINITY_DN10197_c0_g1_i1:138-1406(-)
MSEEKDLTALAEYESDEEDTLLRGSDKVSKDTHISTHGGGFEGFMLKQEILKALSDCGFEHPSEVQHQCIPQAILGTDVLCQAKSGMGKTAVFVLSTLHQLATEQESENLLGLVLVHTRELVAQIQKEFDRLKKYLPGLKVHSACGSVPIAQDVKSIKTGKPHILISTPGRALKLVESKGITLSHLKHFVLDECDIMLESLDMRRDIQAIFKQTPHNKQVMMFTATLSESSRAICKKFMYHPHEIYINEGSKLTLHGLQQYFVNLNENQKNRKLVDLLDALRFNQLVIFVSSVKRAAALNKLLVSESFPSIAFFGQMNPKKRIELYEAFKTNKKPIMVATDIFGRGVDFERVNVVINYDMPEGEDAYLHRVGRAGRFGTKGLAISFVTTDADKEVLEKIRSKFVVALPELPETIDPSTYGSA